MADLLAQHERVNELKHQRIIAGAERNAVVAKVKAAVSAQNKRDVLPEDLRAESAANKQKISNIDAQLGELEHGFSELLESVPNLVDPHVMSISGDYEVVHRTGPESPAGDPSLDHVEIGSYLGILDVPNASRVSGMGNAYLVGQGALLEQALIAYALKKCTTEFGFTMVSPPSLVRPEYNAACGFRPRGVATQIYEVAGADLCLSGTAEIPLASQLAMHALDPADLPVKRCGVMRSFRAEAGSRGTDTRGLYRLHEFSKVEMFLWSAPQDSARLLHELVGYQQNVFAELLGDMGVPMRTINIAPSDLGNPAYQKFDIEAWMPGRQAWGELSSASNCLDFQARRLHTTIKNEKEFVHTLNGTAIAVPRVILAILENGFDKTTKTVKLPKALWPYMGKEITKQ